ncbi:MAG: glutamate-1-semialdehyde 2,1-aminomutase [Bacteriovoracaceae bacterium]
MSFATSEELFQRSLKLVPGGVHSPVRSFKGMNVTPRFFQRAYGAYIEEVNGKNYIDFCMSFGPLILGHKNEIVEKKLVEALSRGWSYGACEPYSLELAEFIKEKIPFIEQMRFVSSGTEAVMTAIRLARGATGKNKIVKFDGCYHGHVDSMLIKAGSGLAGTADASSLGVPDSIAKDTLIVDLNDIPALRKVFEVHGSEIAGIIVEPLPANNGLMIQDVSYLKEMKTLCEKYNALLIFDEVISGFRVAFGGMAELTGITPDIVTYGKIIGGGLPVGAVAASKKIMENLAPIGRVYQAGTLSANPLAMVGGLSTLSQMTAAHYKTMEENTIQIVELFKVWLKKNNYSDINIIQKSSLFWFVPHHNQVKSISDIPANLVEKFNPMFYNLLDRGIYLAPNAYEVGFVSMAHDKAVISELQNRLGI